MRGLLGEIIAKSYQLTVADMEAGLEHLSRADGTLRHVDVLLVTLEPYRKALETARRTQRLATALGIPKIYGVGTKVVDEEDRRYVESFADDLGLPVLASVPVDPVVTAADREGGAVIDLDPDAAIVRTAGEMIDALERAAEPQPAG